VGTGVSAQVRGEARSDASGWVRTIGAALVGSALYVVGLGVATEILVSCLGEETFLQEGRHFDLGEEANLPTWFTSFLMAATAALALVFAATLEHGRRADRLMWAFLGAILLALSIDEVGSFHEALMAHIRDFLGAGGAFHFAWVVVAIPLVLIVGLLFVPFLLRLPKATRLGFAIAGALFVGGALVVEMFGAALVSEQGEESAAYAVAVIVEEAMEIAGMTVFAVAMIRHAAAEGLRIVIAPKA